MSSKDSAVPGLRKTARRRHGRRERLAARQRRSQPHSVPSSLNVSDTQGEPNQNSSVVEDQTSVDLILEPLPGGLELGRLVNFVIMNTHLAPPALLSALVESADLYELTGLERRRVYELIVVMVYVCRHLSVIAAIMACLAVSSSGNVHVGFQTAAFFLVQQSNRPIPAGMTDVVDPSVVLQQHEEILISDDENI